ncbi:hypothetical protein [Fulvimonas soli]|jgi:hypothetical protein|uniref:Uncharacterized protein n=1 Tax=Fulvimonas soli TaxID=155197 RepID=A0A316I2Q9_9GAMM|nr:hypothetical protein [Fulvimonas soli]PWK86646.1 hypothetical protein C7456_10737 [Fulvimonas soli]TNY26334.1 hypothetical protein BV497_09350 [Fulvimonas soli]
MTIAELQLSAAYRLAQRNLGAWLEQGSAGLRQRAFHARSALAPLDPAERARLARWLAWLCVAGRSRGDDALPARLRRLDARLHRAVERALPLLPAGMAPMREPSRMLSA